MQGQVNEIIADLSIRLFRVPEGSVRDILASSQAGDGFDLLGTLSERGYLREEERRLLHSLSEELLRFDAQTRTAYPAPSGSQQDPPCHSLDEFRPLREAEWPDVSRTRYDTRYEHARGGMGRILAVWDRRMQREVALKELLPLGPGEGETRDRVVARFLQEAQITGRLQHPSIIPVHEIGAREDGTLYYTMKFVRGQTLQAAIREARTPEARMALLPHYQDLCQAVAYAHAHGVIHRDIKPSNVMIGEFGETLVIDWGLAKELAREVRAPGPDGTAETADDTRGGNAADLTLDGQLLGTPHYMSPEQATGKHEQLDARSDVYALGAVLYQLLTGSRPYQASSGLEVLRKCAVEPPPPVETLCPEAPPALAAICRRAMERNPARRYPTATALAEEIGRFQAGARVLAHEYGTRELLLRFLRKYRPVVATAAIGLAALAGLGSYSYLSLRSRHALEHELRLKSERDRYDLSIALAQDSIEEFQYDRAHRILDGCPPEGRGWEWGRLRYVIDCVGKALPGHRDGVQDVALTPDGRHLVSIDRIGRAILRTLPGGEVIHTYEAGGSVLSATAIHPAGTEFVTCAEDGSILRWDTRSGGSLDAPVLEPKPLRSAVYSTDGRFLLGGGVDPAIYQWDLATGRILRDFQVSRGPVNCLALSPDGSGLAAGDAGGWLYLWDWPAGNRRFLLDAHTDSRQTGVQGTLSIAFSRDGQWVASAGVDATAKIWGVADGDLRHTLTAHLKKVWSVGFSPDGQTLATVSQGDVKFWDPLSGVEKPSWIRSPYEITHLRFVPEHDRLLSAGGAGDIQLWDLAPHLDAEYLEGHPSEVNAVQFSPDGRYLATAGGHWLKGGDGHVRIWDCGQDGALVPRAPLRVLEGGHEWVNSLAFHPNGQWLSSGDADGRILTWDWRTGALLQDRSVAAYNNGLRCLVYRPDGQRFATAGWAVEAESGLITEWAAGSGEPVREYSGQTGTIDSIAYSADGRYLAAGSRDGSARVWDTASGEVRHTFVPDEGWAYGVAFSPDGRFLATAHSELVVLLWNLNTGTLVQRYEGLHDRANKVVFSPDGTRLASSDLSMTRVWNVATGAPLVGLKHGALDLDFSPDGRTLATAGLDGRVGLWRSEDWRN